MYKIRSNPVSLQLVSINMYYELGPVALWAEMAFLKDKCDHH